jgi:hypothetical protein
MVGVKKHNALLNLMVAYLYSSDTYIQSAAIHCFIVYSGLNLECLDRCMGLLMNHRAQAQADAQSLSEQQKPEMEKLSHLLQKTTALARSISKIVKAYNKDFFELSKDYVLNLLNDSSDQISNCTKGFCENSFIIDSNSPSMVFKAITIANSFHIVAGLLNLKQKWVNIHLMSLLKLWRNFFTECKLTLPTGGKYSSLI